MVVGGPWTNSLRNYGSLTIDLNSTWASPINGSVSWSWVSWLYASQEGDWKEIKY